ncbi:NADH-quinone oxidoreductase subunit N [Salinispira pacifica]
MVESILHALIPHIVVAGAAIVIMLMIAARRMYRASFWVTALALAGAFVVVVGLPPGTQSVGSAPAASAGANPLLVFFLFDGSARFMGALVLAVNFLIALISFRYFSSYGENREEFHLLLLLETLGSLVLVASVHVVSFLLGLELLSVPLYGLLGYVRDRDLPFEAATKYFVLTAGASAVIVFGFSLLYYQEGTLSLVEMSQKISANLNPVSGAGLVLVLSGLAFKLAVFPFHMWAADVYEGSPLPSTAVIATASKIAVFAFLYRFVGPMLSVSADVPARRSIDLAVTVLAVASMLGGNLLALRQTNLKRLLAYSSTANLGYLLVPLAAGSAQSLQSAFFYLTIYAAANLGILATLTLFSSSASERVEIESYSGLLYRRPAVSLVFILMALSLAGLPLSAGFFGKLYLFQSGMAAGRWVLTGVFVAGSTIGLYYYLRMVFVQISHGAAVAQGAQPAHFDTAVDPGSVITLAVAFVFILGIGIFPEQLLSLLNVLGI